MNDENHAPGHIDDLHDRLLDTALVELAGGKTPPDLSARITTAYEASRPSPALQPTSARRGHPARWFAAAIAAMLLVGFTVLLLSGNVQYRGAARTLARNDRLGDERKNSSGHDSAITGNKSSNATTSSQAQLLRLDSQQKAKLTKTLNGQADDSAAKPTTLSIDSSGPGQTGAATVNTQASPANGEASPAPSLPSAWYLSDDEHDRPSAPHAVELYNPWPNSTRAGTNPSSPASPAEVALRPQVAEPADAPAEATAATAPPAAAPTPMASNSYDYSGGPTSRQPQGQNVSETLAFHDQPTAGAKATNLGDNGINDSLRMMVTPQIIAQKESEERLSPEIPGFAAPRELGMGPQSSGDRYVPITENPFIKAEGGAAVSTFSIDVDTASYTNVRQFLLEMNQLPPPDAVRIEELVNYFHYDYAPPANSAAKPPAEPGADKEADAANTPAAPGHGSAGADSAGGPTDEAPFAAHVEVAGCPWNTEHRLARIAVKGREMDRAKRPPSNLVFLVDVSGSMNEPAKLPLVVYGLQQLTKELGENDHIAIVVYAGSEGLALPSTSGSKQDTILAVLQKLQAGGSTAGGAGIQLAYKIAEDSFIKGGTNRVILCTDGDFNVGVTSTAELQRMVEQKAKDTGVFLSVLGFGRGNLNDAMMEAIADHGNGNYHYVDNRTEARRVLVEEMSGTLVTIAKDVKIQVEFNPAQVAAYRLIGYENRMLRTEDFNDDKKDAGEIGAGHTVTALYEVVPAGKNAGIPPVDDLKYQKPSGWLGSSAASPQTRDVPEGSATPRPQPPNASLEDTANDRTDRYVRPTDDAASNELLTLKMRYKAPDGDTSKKLEWPVTDKGESFAAASDDFQFAAAVAGFGLLLRDSQYKGNLSFAADLELAQSGLGPDDGGYRAEFLDMVRAATKLKGE
ncbi:MAG: von Willebrand factor type A domain-containing protein [Pirellulales bacterium]